MEEKEMTGEGAQEGKNPVVLTEVWRRLQERYPEEQPAGGTGWENMYGRYMDDTESELGKYKESETRMTELCKVYPEFAEVVYDMVVNRAPFRVAVAKVFAQEELIPQEGEEDYEAYRTAYDQRVAGVKRRDGQAREIEENEARSIAEIDRFCEAKGMTAGEKEQLTGVINDHFTELLYKRISPEMLEGFFRQMSFDEAVAEAEKAGMIRGRNEQIEARRMKERADIAGDGLPGSSGGGAIRPVEKVQRRSFFDLPERKGI